jgi:hypothetical protein
MPGPVAPVPFEVNGNIHEEGSEHDPHSFRYHTLSKRGQFPTGLPSITFQLSVSRAAK